MPELIEKAEIRTYTTKDGEEIIRDIVLKNVTFNYTFVTAPKPKELKGNGETYETNVIIKSEEVWNTFVEAFNRVYRRAVKNTWKGRTPALDTMNIPFYIPKKDENGEYYPLEEDAIAVLKTKNKQQPELFLRDEGPLRVAGEDDINEFYSGMVGDAVISFWAYDSGTGPKPGIMLFINGVCKVAKGEPLTFVGSNYDFAGAFSDGEDTAAAFKEQKVVKATTPTPATTPAPEPAVAPGLQDLLGKKESTKTEVKTVLDTKANILDPSPTVNPIESTEEVSSADILKNLMKGKK